MPKKVFKIQTVIHNNMRNRKDIQWDDANRQVGVNSAWFNINEKKWGSGLTPVAYTLGTNRICRLYTYLTQGRHPHKFGLIQTAHHMERVAQNDWARPHEDIVFWDPNATRQTSTPGEWHQQFPWWQERLTLWLKQGWSLKLETMTTTAIRRVPV